MLAEIAACDAVIGSRNIRGGGVEGWSVLRNMVSKGGSLYSRLVLGCPVRDLTGGFNMWTRNTLEKIGLDAIISKGYSFQIEMKYRAYKAGCSIWEIPIIFSDRKKGASKMSKQIFLEALVNILKIKKAVDKKSGAEPVRQSGRPSNKFIEQFGRFFITGGLGTITNLVIFFLCADVSGLPEIPVSVACFLIAATQNYVINHKWSFGGNMADTPLSFNRWLKFICASLLGLAINITVMKTILLYFALPYKFIAQACGIICGMMANFTMSKLLVFRRK
jgi:putative flippase GtrA